MVFNKSNMSTLEPPDSTIDENLANIDLEMPNVETDSDDEGGALDAYHGYEPLATGPDNVQDSMVQDMDEDNQEVSEEQANNDNNSNGIPNIVPVEAELVREVWSQPSSSTDIQMDAERISEVKRAMLNFSLPATNIPDWASNVPEEQWKDSLLMKLNWNKKS